MTEARAAFEHLPPLYLRRYVRHWGSIERHARALGLEAEDLSRFLRASRLVEGAAPLPLSTLRCFAPYDARGAWASSWDAAARAGLAREVDGGWAVTERGRAVITDDTAEWWAQLSAEPPTAEAARAAAALDAIRVRIEPQEIKVPAFRRYLATQPPAATDVVRAVRLAQELLEHRDDCHVASWREAGYDGPALDILTRVWRGASSVAVLAEGLRSTQSPDDVERGVRELVRRGDLARDGDALALTPAGRAARERIEADTDRRYFVGWPRSDALVALERDLRALVPAAP